MEKILVVDDDPDSADSLVLLLRLTGFEATAVYSAGMALERLASHPADAVITDIEMPGFRGSDLLRHLRAMPLHADMLLVAHSGLPQASVDLESPDYDFY